MGKLIVAEREFTSALTPDLVDGGYTVSCREISAAISQAETIQEGIENLVDAIQLCLELEEELQRIERG